jgi:TonB family protein
MKVIFVMIFCVLSIIGFSQGNGEKLYLFDADFNSVKNRDKASIFLVTEKVNDTSYKYTYYNIKTMRAITVEHFSDEKGTLPNGMFGYYNAFNGQLDSAGYVVDGIRNGYWSYYNALSTNPDSAIEIKQYKLGKQIILEKKYIQKDMSKVEDADTRRGFIRLLEQNLKYPKEAQDAGVQGIVKLFFNVTATGAVEDLILAKSVNYFLDKEALRILKLSSGRWKAALVDNLAIKTYHFQAINFVLAQ